MTSLTVVFPLDNGFLRRECCACLRQFKWHHGPSDDTPPSAVEPEKYTCPYCGQQGNADSWLTAAQVDVVEQVTSNAAAQMLNKVLSKSLGKSSFLKITSSPPSTTAPRTLIEPADMVQVQSPCHPWEPIKIATTWIDPVHCIVCGARYMV